jgi:hypothetical protein
MNCWILEMSRNRILTLVTYYEIESRKRIIIFFFEKVAQMSYFYDLQSLLNHCTKTFLCINNLLQGYILSL